VITSSVAVRAASPAFDMGDIPPKTEAVEDAAKRARETHCSTADCVAVMTIDEAFEIISDSEATTIGAARYLPIARPSRIKRLFRVKLLSHPDRFAAICARATDLASQFGNNKDSDPDQFVSHTIIEIAYLMDSTGHGQCLPAVLSAFPPSAAVDTAMINAHQLCTATPWGKPSCETIAPRSDRQQETRPVH